MLATDESLAQQIDVAITTSPYLAGKKLRFEMQDGHVVLQGRVTSYFQKQMAQEALRKIDGVRRIDNQLEVGWNSEA
jgi:osmotically-inducible protein OsmY